MTLRRVLGWAVVAFLAYYLLTSPTGAASSVHSLLGMLKDVGSSIATFLNSLGKS